MSLVEQQIQSPVIGPPSLISSSYDLEPEYGCEHLARAIISGDLANSGFADSMLKTISRAVGPAAPSNGKRQSRPRDAFSTRYDCLQCTVAGDFAALDLHAKSTKHYFSLNSRSCMLYCARCKDLIYDQTAERLMLGGNDKSRNAPKKRTSIEANGDDSYLTANSSQRPCGKEGVRGLINLGETCYMNAILQMMVHNQLLSSYFLGTGHPIHTCEYKAERESKEREREDMKPDTDGDANADPTDDSRVCIACTLSEVFAESRMIDKTEPMHAVNLLFASWKSFAHMAGLGQQDSHEWYLMIVDKLHESAEPMLDSKGRCKCFFHKAFFGRLQSEVTCDTCSLVSRTQEPFSDINIDFQKQARRKKKAAAVPVVEVPNLEACLTSYTTPETLPAEAYKCRGCGVPRTASKRLRIRKLPAILCMQVKRFGVRMVGNTCIEEKYEGKIDFPLEINMAPYTTKPQSKNKHEFVYDLETVVVHDGKRIQNGHFFAFCRQEQQWFKYDDEIVSVTSMQEVLRQEAYLLFYSLRSLNRSADHTRALR